MRRDHAAGPARAPAIAVITTVAAGASRVLRFDLRHCARQGRDLRGAARRAARPILNTDHDYLHILFARAREARRRQACSPMAMTRRPITASRRPKAAGARDLRRCRARGRRARPQPPGARPAHDRQRHRGAGGGAGRGDRSLRSFCANSPTSAQPRAAARRRASDRPTGRCCWSTRATTPTWPR